MTAAQPPDFEHDFESWLARFEAQCRIIGQSPSTIAARTIGTSQGLDRTRRALRKATERLAKMQRAADELIGPGIKHIPALISARVALPPLPSGSNEPPSITLDLPLPPSTNKLWKPINDGPSARTVSSRDYRAWQKLAGGEIIAQRPKWAARSLPFDWSYSVLIELPVAMKGDVANREKALTDLLVRALIVPDDQYCDDTRQMRSPDVPTGRCRVTVRPLMPFSQRTAASHA